MKLVPPFIFSREADPDLPPVNAGECHVFSLLKSINVSDCDVALHSLNLTRHRARKRWSEIDFLVLSGRGVLVLEVKGGAVSCRDGIWSYSGKSTTRSPAAQAKENYFTLMDQYLEREPQFRKLFDHVPGGWACIFVDTRRLQGLDESALCEQGDEITCYDEEAASAEGLKGFLNRVYDYWAGKRKSPRRLEPSQVETLTRFLRPSFERAPSLNSSLRTARASFQKFTDEQYEKLDMLHGLDRFMLEGGAGTGKSFLALYAARGYAAAGERSAFVTRMPPFASYARGALTGSGVHVAILGELLESTRKDGPFDVLVLDEAQDLCTWDAVEILDQAVTGGIAQGRWAWFGDSNHQVSPSVRFDQEVYELFRDSAIHKPPPLRRNVRNTPEVVKTIGWLTAADIGIAPDKGVGREVSIGEATDIAGAIAEVKQALSGFLEDGLGASEIVLLTPTEATLPACERILAGLGLAAERVESPHFDFRRASDRPLIATVEGYKGLERPVVFLVGFWAMAEPGQRGQLQSLLYKAISRANHTVFIAADAHLRGALRELAADNLKRAIAT